PRAVHVATLAGNAARLLLRRRARTAGGRCGDLVRAGQTGVIAIEPADCVVRAEEVVVREPAVEAELDGVVLPLRTRNRERRGRTGHRRDRGDAAARVRDHVHLIAARVERTEVFDGLEQVVVDVVHAHDAVAIELELVARARARLLHRLEIRVDAAGERRHATVTAG